MDPAEYAERRRVVDEQYKADYGQMALDIRNCLVDGAYKKLTPQDWWVDRIWKSRGVEYLNVEKYIEKVYNKPKSKWLLCFGSAPKEYTWQPEGAYINTELALEKLMCAKDVYGDKVNIGFIEYGRGEKIKEAFDFNDRRMQEKMPVCAFIDGNVAYHTRQYMWDAEQMVQFIDEPHEGSTYTQTVPHPVNDITLYFEYWKREAVYDRFLLNPLMEYVGTEYPRFYDMVCKDLFGTHLGIKTVGRNVILLIYLPIVLTILYALRLVTRLLCWMVCPKKK